MRQKLKIYSYYSDNLKEYAPVSMLCPLYGFKDWEWEMQDEKNAQRGSMKEYFDRGKDIFELSAVEDCDFMVFPFRWEYTFNSKVLLELAHEFDRLSALHNKPVVIIYQGEWELSKIPHPFAAPFLKNCYIFAHSVFKSKSTPNTFGFPHFIADSLERYYNGELLIRNKKPKPLVGFCGYAPPINLPLGKQKVKETLRLYSNEWGLLEMLSMNPGHSYRTRALQSLQKSKQVDTNFVIRGELSFGGKFGVLTPGSNETMEDFRKKYFDNIQYSDYIVCARGFANSSIRFYETLCHGRIPIFIDTDCSLPYDFALNYKDFCVWVDYKDLNYIDSIVAEFHNKLSNQDFRDIQVHCRKMWEDFTSPLGFFSNFYQHFASSPPLSVPKTLSS